MASSYLVAWHVKKSFSTFIMPLLWYVLLIWAGGRRQQVHALDSMLHTACDDDVPALFASTPEDDVKDDDHEEHKINSRQKQTGLKQRKNANAKGKKILKVLSNVGICRSPETMHLHTEVLSPACRPGQSRQEGQLLSMQQTSPLHDTASCCPRQQQRPIQLGTSGVTVAWTVICAAI